jgi:glycine/D-amino acid oxidase-like deaminating enzyme
MVETSCDALIIGGGFYGCEVALHLRRLGFDRVMIVEREAGLMRRASFVNQARVHNGYHYPRSYSTAVRSRQNFWRFANDYREAVANEFEKVYAIARGSNVSASQFAAFCRSIDAPCRPAPKVIERLFDAATIEASFITQEFAFDAARLAAKLARELDKAGVELRFGATARVRDYDDRIVTLDVDGRRERAAWVFNCTYGGLEQVGIRLRSRIKKEMAEMLLIEPPLPLRGLGVTVMDGPYFSTMPFPAAGLHSLSHVRYTPHEASAEVAPRLKQPTKSNRDYMIRDAARYMPHLAGANVIRSIFEVKAVLSRSEGDDGRPILVERSEDTRRVVSILGSKIDNIYDVRDFLSGQTWN